MHAFRAFSSLHSGSASFCGALFLVCIACGSSASPSSDPSGLPGPSGPPPSGVQLTDDFGGRRLFPDDNWWNADISGAPVDPQSSAYIDYVGPACRGDAAELHRRGNRPRDARDGAGDEWLRLKASKDLSSCHPALGSLRGDDFEVIQLGWR